MTPAEKGRFCTSCQKNVIDFTRSSDREIATAFAKDQKMCGRFLETQLDRDLAVTTEKSTLWVGASAAAISFLGLGTHDSEAQKAPTTEQCEPKMHYIGKPAAPSPNTVTITGVVCDDLGPLPGASVMIQGTEKIVATDSDGKFTIEAWKGAVLEINFIDFKPEYIEIDNRDHYTVKMILPEQPLDVTMGIYVAIQRRTFFGRIFHSIGNWFR